MATTDQHPADEHSTAVTPHEGHQAATRHGADPHAEPSADWGWHGEFPKASNIAGWITVIALFGMLIGNHRTGVADVWLIGLGTLLVIMLVGGQVNRLRSRRR